MKRVLLVTMLALSAFAGNAKADSYSPYCKIQTTDPYCYYEGQYRYSCIRHGAFGRCLQYGYVCTYTGGPMICS